MPDTRESRYRALEQMSDDELRQILRDDASNFEGEDTDMEYILHAMEVLATRRKERGEGKSPAQALDSFNENYCTNKQNSLISEKVRGTTKKHAGNLWKRLTAAAAVLVLVIAFSTVTASAWNFDLWETISQWTKETFRFGSYGEDYEENGYEPCATLQDALNRFDIDTKLIPKWFPSGYAESGIDILENPLQRVFCARYQSENEEIIIRITDYLGEDPCQVEQSEDLLEVYTSGDVHYYIFENNGKLQTVWTNETFECFIISTLNLDEIKMMIDSIEKG